jgi:hypothetical protein
MWNVPYAVAAWDPWRYRLALIIAIVMQAIGLAGELLIYTTLQEANNLLLGGIARFILFDTLGLVALLVALWWSWRR